MSSFTSLLSSPPPKKAEEGGGEEETAAGGGRTRKGEQEKEFLCDVLSRRLRIPRKRRRRTRTRLDLESRNNDIDNDFNGIDGKEAGEGEEERRRGRGGRGSDDVDVDADDGDDDNFDGEEEEEECAECVVCTEPLNTAATAHSGDEITALTRRLLWQCSHCFVSLHLACFISWIRQMNNMNELKKLNHKEAPTAAGNSSRSDDGGDGGNPPRSEAFVAATTAAIPVAGQEEEEEKEAEEKEHTTRDPQEKNKKMMMLSSNAEPFVPSFAATRSAPAAAAVPSAGGVMTSTSSSSLSQTAAATPAEEAHGDVGAKTPNTLVVEQQHGDGQKDDINSRRMVALLQSYYNASTEGGGYRSHKHNLHNQFAGSSAAAGGGTAAASGGTSGRGGFSSPSTASNGSGRGGRKEYLLSDFLFPSSSSSSLPSTASIMPAAPSHTQRIVNDNDHDGMEGPGSSQSPAERREQLLICCPLCRTSVDAEAVEQRESGDADSRSEGSTTMYDLIRSLVLLLVDIENDDKVEDVSKLKQNQAALVADTGESARVKPKKDDGEKLFDGDDDYYFDDDNTMMEKNDHDEEQERRRAKSKLRQLCGQFMCYCGKQSQLDVNYDDNAVPRCIVAGSCGNVCGKKVFIQLPPPTEGENGKKRRRNFFYCQRKCHPGPCPIPSSPSLLFDDDDEEAEKEEDGWKVDGAPQEEDNEDEGDYRKESKQNADDDGHHHFSVSDIGFGSASTEKKEKEKHLDNGARTTTSSTTDDSAATVTPTPTTTATDNDTSTAATPIRMLPTPTAAAATTAPTPTLTPMEYPHPNPNCPLGHPCPYETAEAHQGLPCPSHCGVIFNDFDLFDAASSSFSTPTQAAGRQQKVVCRDDEAAFSTDTRNKTVDDGKQLQQQQQKNMPWLVQNALTHLVLSGNRNHNGNGNIANKSGTGSEGGLGGSVGQQEQNKKSTGNNNNGASVKNGKGKKKGGKKKGGLMDDDDFDRKPLYLPEPAADPPAITEHRPEKEPEIQVQTGKAALDDQNENENSKMENKKMGIHGQQGSESVGLDEPSSSSADSTTQVIMARLLTCRCGGSVFPVSRVPCHVLFPSTNTDNKSSEQHESSSSHDNSATNNEALDTTEKKEISDTISSSSHQRMHQQRTQQQQQADEQREPVQQEPALLRELYKNFRCHRKCPLRMENCTNFGTNTATNGSGGGGGGGSRRGASASAATSTAASPPLLLPSPPTADELFNNNKTVLTSTQTPNSHIQPIPRHNHACPETCCALSHSLNVNVCDMGEDEEKKKVTMFGGGEGTAGGGMSPLIITTPLPPPLLLLLFHVLSSLIMVGSPLPSSSHHYSYSVATTLDESVALYGVQLSLSLHTTLNATAGIEKDDKNDPLSSFNCTSSSSSSSQPSSSLLLLSGEGNVDNILGGPDDFSKLTSMAPALMIAFNSIIMNDNEPELRETLFDRLNDLQENVYQRHYQQLLQLHAVLQQPLETAAAHYVQTLRALHVDCRRRCPKVPPAPCLSRMNPMEQEHYHRYWRSVGRGDTKTETMHHHNAEKSEAEEKEDVESPPPQKPPTQQNKKQQPKQQQSHQSPAAVPPQSQQQQQHVCGKLCYQHATKTTATTIAADSEQHAAGTGMMSGSGERERTHHNKGLELKINHPCGACEEGVIYDAVVYCHPLCKAVCAMPPLPCGVFYAVGCTRPCAVPRPCGHAPLHPCHPPHIPCPPCTVLVVPDGEEIPKPCYQVNKKV